MDRNSTLLINTWWLYRPLQLSQQFQQRKRQNVKDVDNPKQLTRRMTVPALLYRTEKARTPDCTTTALQKEKKSSINDLQVTAEISL